MCFRWLQAETQVATIGPSGLRVLPLAAGINEGGHYFRFFFLFFLLTTAIQNHRRGCLGFQIFAWAPKKNNNNRFLGFLKVSFENFEGDSVDMCAGKFPLTSMGG